MINFKLKCKNEDFEVTEIPLIPKLFPKKISQYTYIWIEKNGITTFEAIEVICKYFNIDYSDINTEGLKDEKAITYQILSLKKILSVSEVISFNKIHLKEKTLKIKDIIGYGNQPVAERSLYGNSFKIKIRNLSEQIATKLRHFCLNNRYITFVNYYDMQRFGTDGGPYNNHLLGDAIIKNDWKRAYLEFQKTKNDSIDSQITPKRVTFANKYKTFFKGINPKKLPFFISANNSYLWNNKTSLILQKLNKGSKYDFENVGKLFIPQDINFKSYNLCLINGYVFSEKDFKVRRKVIARNIIVNTTVFPGTINKDEIHTNKYQLTVSFLLPIGCYATMLIKQIFLR